MLLSFINMFKLTFLTFLTLWSFTSAKPNKVVCYFGSWSNYRKSIGQFKVEDINTDLCTHLIYSFVGINSDGTFKILDSWLDIDLKAYEKFVALKKKKSGLKTMIAIGGYNEGSEKFSAVVSNSDTRSKFVKNAVKFLNTYKFDGLDLDWEYPAQRGGKASDKANFGLLVKELREAFDKENPSWILSAAVQTTKDGIDKSYDIAKMAKYLNFINLMTYDLHGSWDGVTGHHTALYRNPSTDTTDFQKQLNVDACVNAWINAGTPSNKINLGLASYGKTYTLTSSSNNGVGAATSGNGEQGQYTQEAGMLAYYEICEKVKSGGWTEKWIDSQQVPYVFKGNQWIAYDNVKSIEAKIKYGKNKNLGGFMIWSIETDDFRGTCGTKYPLLNAIKKGIS